MKASECKCVKCGRQAVAFWPVIDPDIPSHPYCRECLDKERQKLMIKLSLETQKVVSKEKKKKPKENHYPRGC